MKNETLFDAIKDDETKWNKLVHQAVKHALAGLGKAVYQLEWADKYRTANKKKV